MLFLRLLVPRKATALDDMMGDGHKGEGGERDTLVTNGLVDNNVKDKIRF